MQVFFSFSILTNINEFNDASEHILFLKHQEDISVLQSSVAELKQCKSCPICWPVVSLINQNLAQHPDHVLF